MWFLRTDTEVMGNRLVHGDTTSKETFIVEFVKKPESERSFLPEFPNTVICSEVFACYLRHKKKKEERNLWRLNILD